MTEVYRSLDMTEVLSVARYDRGLSAVTKRLQRTDHPSAAGFDDLISFSEITGRILGE